MFNFPFFFYLPGQGDTVYLLVQWPPGTQTFGHFWFMVDAASVGTRGVAFTVRVVRAVLQGDDAPSGKCPHCGKFPNASGEDPAASEDPLNLSEVAAQLQGRRFRFKEEWVS